MKTFDFSILQYYNIDVKRKRDKKHDKFKTIEKGK